MAAAPRCSRGFASLFSSTSRGNGFSQLHPTANTGSTTILSSSPRLLQPTTQIRTHATTRRSTKRLRVQPAPSAPRPHGSAVTHGAVQGTSATPAVGTTLSFDPPSSAPNPFHTPSIFLPEGDPRRKLYASMAATANKSVATVGPSAVGGSRNSLDRVYNPYAADPNRPLPPIDRPAPETSGKYHLTQEDLKEMRALRKEDPRHWTRARLAKKFKCSELFVAMGAPTLPEHGNAWWAKRNAALARQSPRAMKARADMMKRKELWYRDA